MIAAGVVGVGSQVARPARLLRQPRPRTSTSIAGVPSGGCWCPRSCWCIGLVGVGRARRGRLPGHQLGLRADPRRAARSWHLRRGLLTTRETSHRRRPARAASTIGEPLGLRLAGGGRLSAIVTGLDRNERGSSALVPPAPRAVVEGGRRRGARHGRRRSTPRCVGHGPRARTRRYTRALVPALLVLAAAAVVLVAVTGGAWWLLAVGAAARRRPLGLAADRARALGPRAGRRHLVARSGSLDRQRARCWRRRRA